MSKQTIASILVAATVGFAALVANPQAGLSHQVNDNVQNSNVTLQFTAELLDPWDEDQSVTQGSADLASYHTLRLTLHNPNISSRNADLRGWLYADTTEDLLDFVEVTPDNPNTEQDESTDIVYFGLPNQTSGVKTLQGGANSISAKSEGYCAQEGLIKDKTDCHTITRQSGP